MSPLTESTRLICKNYGTPAAIAGVAPTLDYRFALDRTELDAVTLTDKLTFTRAATCAFTNLGGNLELAGANIPRFDHSLSTQQSLGLLLEETRTNRFLYSEQFDNAYWNRSNLSVAANSALAPDNTMTADKLVPNTVNSAHETWRATGVTGSYTTTIYAKSGGYNGLVVNPYGSSFSEQIRVNLSTGTINTISSGATGSLTALANGWYRITISTSLPSGADVYITVANNNISSFAGDGTSGVFVWGVQLETGTFPTSYIPTVASTVTRTETATVSLSGLPATRTLVEKPVGCATVAGDTLTLNAGYTAERVMVFPTALSGAQVTAIRSAM